MCSSRLGCSHSETLLALRSLRLIWHLHCYHQRQVLAVKVMPLYSNRFSTRVSPPCHLRFPAQFADSLLLSSAGANPELVQRGLAKLIVKFPVQEPPPSECSFSPAMGKVIVTANKIAKDKNDSYVAQDHLILALVQDASIASILKEAGVTPEAIVKTADQVRGGKQVNSRSAEEGFDALNKYARDLTAEAEQGKLDPVIGRDNEIRRCIRILSRRTKNNPVCIGEPGVGKTAVNGVTCLLPR